MQSNQSSFIREDWRELHVNPKIRKKGAPKAVAHVSRPCHIWTSTNLGAGPTLVISFYPHPKGTSKIQFILFSCIEGTPANISAATYIYRYIF